MHKKRYGQRALTGNHNIYRASNPAGGSSEAGFTPPEKTPDNMEALVARVIQSHGYEARNKDSKWANFTFSEAHAANYAVNPEEPDIFIVRVSKSKALKNHRYNLDAGIKKQDFFLDSLSLDEIYALVVPPGHEKQVKKQLTENGLKNVARRTTSPSGWPNNIKQKKKVLAEYLSEL